MSYDYPEQWSDTEVVIDHVLALHRVSIRRDRRELPYEIYLALKDKGLLKENTGD